MLGPEELEGEYDGEELRMEVFLSLSFQVSFTKILQLLEAEVERPPPRSISVDDEFISDLPPLPMSPALDGESVPSLGALSFPESRPYLRRSRSSSSSIIQGGSPTKQVNERSSPTVESLTSPLTPISPGAVHSPVSPGPLPYLPRRRSSSSAISTGSGLSS